MLKLWQGIKEWGYKYVGSLFMEEKAGKIGSSLGRVALVGLLTLAGSKWHAGEDIPNTMLYIMGGLLTYVTGTKFAPVKK